MEGGGGGEANTESRKGRILRLQFVTFTVLFLMVMLFAKSLPSPHASSSTQQSTPSSSEDVRLLSGDTRLFALEDFISGTAVVQYYPSSSSSSSNLSSVSDSILDSFLFVGIPPKVTETQSTVSLVASPLLSPNSTQRVFQKFLLSGSSVSMQWSASSITNASSSLTSSLSESISVLVLKSQPAYQAWREKLWTEAFDPSNQVFHQSLSQHGSHSFTTTEMIDYYFIFVGEESVVGWAEINATAVAYAVPQQQSSTYSDAEGLAEQCSLDVVKECHHHISPFIPNYLLLSSSSSSTSNFTDITDLGDGQYYSESAAHITIKYIHEGYFAGGSGHPSSGMRARLRQASMLAGFVVCVFFITCVFGLFIMSRRTDPSSSSSSSSIEMHHFIPPPRNVDANLVWMRNGGAASAQNHQWFNVFLGGLHGLTPSSQEPWISDPPPLYPGTPLADQQQQPLHEGEREEDELFPRE